MSLILLLLYYLTFKSNIENLKISIIALNSADNIAIAIGEEFYVNQINRIYKVLNNADFGGKKIFDGSMANDPGVRLPSQSLPTNVVP